MQRPFKERVIAPDAATAFSIVGPRRGKQSYSVVDPARSYRDRHRIESSEDLADELLYEASDTRLTAPKHCAIICDGPAWIVFGFREEDT